MSGPSKAIAHKRARVASLSYAVRAGSRPQSDLDAAKCDLAYVGLAEHAAKVVANWPNPSDEQLARVAAIMRGASPPTPSPQPGSSGGTTSPSETREAVVAERIAELDGGGR